jgi:hypothetical protein
VAIAAEREKEHVRRRVDRAQAAVDVERAGRQVLSKALRNHDLEGVAGVDVLAGGVDHRVELAGGHVRLPSPAIRPGHRRGTSVLREPSLHLIDASHRVAILLAVGPVNREQAQAPRDVVEDRQVLRAKECGLGHRRRGAGRDRQPLEVTRRLVAEVTDRAAMEPRNAGHRRLGRDRPERRQRVAFAELELVRLVADERIAGQPLASLDALEEESRRVLGAQE